MVENKEIVVEKNEIVVEKKEIVVEKNRFIGQDTNRWSNKKNNVRNIQHTEHLPLATPV